jgi:hypothetical protein
VSEIAKRLTKFSILFMGPHSAQLFKAVYVPPTEYDSVFIGTGESKAVASARAMSHMRGAGYGSVFNQIEELVQKHMPARPTSIEGNKEAQVYCIIGISAE